MSRAKEERVALRAQTTELLNNLGPNAEAVAGRLESAGVKGVPGSGTGCAVARYVNAVMASDPRIGPINVNDEAVTIFGRHWWTRPVIVPVPAGVRSFILRFDRDEFRHLAVAPGSRRNRPALDTDLAKHGDQAGVTRRSAGTARPPPAARQTPDVEARAEAGGPARLAPAAGLGAGTPRTVLGICVGACTGPGVRKGRHVLHHHLQLAGGPAGRRRADRAVRRRTQLHAAESQASGHGAASDAARRKRKSERAQSRHDRRKRH